MFAKSRALRRQLEEQRDIQAKVERAKNAPRMDDNLPLGIQLNGYIEVDPVSFFLVQDQGIAAKCPDNKREVVAYGRLPVLGGTTQHRFYLEGDEGFVLRVVTNGKNEVVEDETVLFSEAEMRSVPANEAEWNAWLGKKKKAPKKPGKKKKVPSSVIGYETYQIGDEDSPLYFRLVETDDASDEDEHYLKQPQIRPIVGRETYFIDPHDLRGKVADRHFMFYGRVIGEDEDSVSEYVTVSSVSIADEAWVESLVGLPVSHGDLRII